MWLRLGCDNARRGSDVRVRTFTRAHKGWTLLIPTHWRSAQISEGERRAAHTDSLLREQTPNYNVLKKKVPEVQSGGLQKWWAHLFPEAAHTGLRRGHKCEGRARERLRCTQPKLAPHLECRSHQWKMPTSYPNFSSGKTTCVSVSYF